MTNMQPKHAWFSPLMAKSCGFSTFKTDTGETVQVTTAVDVEHRNPKMRDGINNPHSRWGDETYVGVVTEFIASEFKATIAEDPSKKAVKKNWKRKGQKGKPKNKQRNKQKK